MQPFLSPKISLNLLIQLINPRTTSWRWLKTRSSSWCQRVSLSSSCPQMNWMWAVRRRFIKLFCLGLILILPKEDSQLLNYWVVLGMRAINNKYIQILLKRSLFLKNLINVRTFMFTHQQNQIKVLKKRAIRLLFFLL